MSDHDSELDQPADGGVDKMQAELLAAQLAESNREALEAKHRLNEVENGRVFRSIQLVKKSLVNPVWGIKNIRQFAGLLKRRDVPPLPDSQPTAKDYLDNAGIAHLPPSLHAAPRSLRYPNIKIASIGNPGMFSHVAHTFMVDRSEWKDLLDLGVDFVLITDFELAQSSFGKTTIKQFREQKGRALADEKARFLWWITSQEQLKNPLIQKDDIRLLAHPDVHKAKPSGPSMVVQPSVDSNVYNPVNWLNKPRRGLFAVSEKQFKDTALDAAQQIDGEATAADVGVVLTDTESARVDVFKKSKSYRAVLCEPEWFSDTATYAQTVLQLLASGAPVLTSGNALLEHTVPTRLEVSAAAYKKVSNNARRERHSIELRQKVLREHSHLARFEELLKNLKIDTRPTEKISIIMSTMSQRDIEHALKNVASQAWPNKELILILHGAQEGGFDIKKIRSITDSFEFDVKILEQAKDTVFGSNLNLALYEATGDYVTKMDDDDWYGPNHLHDLHLAYQYSGATAVGKWANFVYLTGKDVMVDFVTHREERFVRHLPGATVFMKRNDARNLLFGRVKRAIDSELYRRAEVRGGRLYSMHRYNFIRVRHNDHTYDQDEEDFIANASSKPRPGLDKDASFI